MDPKNELEIKKKLILSFICQEIQKCFIFIQWKGFVMFTLTFAIKQNMIDNFDVCTDTFDVLQCQKLFFVTFWTRDCMTGKIATLEVSLEGKALTTPVLLEHSGWKSPKKSHFRKITKLTIFGIFNQLLSTQNVSVARFARNFEWDFFCDFQPLC